VIDEPAAVALGGDGDVVHVGLQLMDHSSDAVHHGVPHRLHVLLSPAGLGAGHGRRLADDDDLGALVVVPDRFDHRGARIDADDSHETASLLEIRWVSGRPWSGTG
jgi:hypothetical protein